MNIYIYIYHYEHIRKCIMFEEKAFIIQIPDILLFVMLVWKNLEDLQLATTGVVGGVLVALPFSSFNSYLLRKRKSEQKKL